MISSQKLVSRSNYLKCIQYIGYKNIYKNIIGLNKLKIDTKLIF